MSAGKAKYLESFSELRALWDGLLCLDGNAGDTQYRRGWRCQRLFAPSSPPASSLGPLFQEGPALVNTSPEASSHSGFLL